MRVVVFGNSLGLGGTDKAAVRWARGLSERGHTVSIVSLQDGPRRWEAEAHGIPVHVVSPTAPAIAIALRDLDPEVLHVHAPGQPHTGDVLGEALRDLRKIPVVQTNVFGRLDNPKEDEWTDFRLFISWTSCVQAARRSYRRLDERFFERASVAVYPLDALEPVASEAAAAFRTSLGVEPDEILFGRLARPDPSKWTDLAVDAFRLAHRRNPKVKLLLREPPPKVAAALRASPDADRFIVLEATSDNEQLRLTLSSLDVVLHTSAIGESFGYGVAEPMNLGRPVITHSVPWRDQAQIELVRHGECGYVASTPSEMSKAMLRLAESTDSRRVMGAAAQEHIRKLADPSESLDRLESALRTAIEGVASPLASQDLHRARAASAHVRTHQFGHSLEEQLALRPGYYRSRVRQFRQRT